MCQLMQPTTIPPLSPLASPRSPLSYPHRSLHKRHKQLQKWHSSPPVRRQCAPRWYVVLNCVPRQCHMSPSERLFIPHFSLSPPQFGTYESIVRMGWYSHGETCQTGVRGKISVSRCAATSYGHARAVSSTQVARVVVICDHIANVPRGRVDGRQRGRSGVGGIFPWPTGGPGGVRERSSRTPRNIHRSPCANA